MSLPQKHVRFILGTHTIGDATTGQGLIHFDKPSEVNELLNAFYTRGYRELDTASNYNASEQRLGAANAPSRFIVHTKVKGFGAGTLEPAKIAESIDASLADLNVSCVETMFLHVPDRQTPLEDTLRAMDEAHRLGKFKHFGLSNYNANEVKQIVEICEEKGWVMPSVFEGHYNAIVRGGEAELFPILRKYGIAFWAYSPAAGGFFSGNTSNAARWNDNTPIGKTYNSLYKSPAVRNSVTTVDTAAKKYGIDGHSAAIRWTAYHGALDPNLGDAVVFGVSKVEQLHKTLDALEAGRLPGELADAIGEIYESLEGSGPTYHL